MSTSGTPQSQAQFNGQWKGVGTGMATDGQQTMSNDNGGARSESADAIRVGKQRARETIAAVGMGGAAPQQGVENSTPNGASNGAHGLSRKRSRDGSQLPLQQPQSRTADAPENDDHLIKDEVLLDRYVQRDLLAIAAQNDQTERMRDLAKYKEDERDFYMQEVGRRRRQDPGTIFGTGFAGYGNGTTNGPSRILYASQRMPPAHRKAGTLRAARKDNAQQAEQHEELVPVRLDLELDKLRLRDTFTWNLHEKLVTPEMFTDHLLEDLKVPQDHLQEVGRQVRTEMVDQILNYYPHIFVEDGPAEQGKPYTEHKDDEMRIQIKLSITIGRITLIDQFEWDINNPQNSPEEFAKVMACENALSGEFTTAIAHSIREQTQLYTKSLWLTNHAFDGRPLEDPDLKDSLLPTPMVSTFRPQQMQSAWTPYMYEMSEAELERTETSMMREHRAQKRQLNRRGGPALPDLKDRQRTVRSLIVHSVIPGAVESWEITGIPRTRRSGRGGARRPGARADEEMDSDELDSEGSGAESPAPAALNALGTTRTRGMRGAASAAQIAMRAGYGRSQTPDAQMLATPQHESRTSARRSMLREEGSVVEDDTLIVKLRIGKARLKAWLEDYNAKKRASLFPLSGYASQPAPSALAPTAAAAARGGTPSKNALGTPSILPKALPAARERSQPNGRTRGKQITHDHLGRIEATHWPAPTDESPPIPAWLDKGISTLRAQHPDSSFTGFMKAYLLSPTSDEQIRPREPLQPGMSGAEAGGRVMWLPRIRCNDCPGKVYTTLEGSVVEGFEVHLKNRNHRGKVEERKAGRG